ncbi:extracellular solute-binding protein [Cellulomonas sp. zg-ZUI222]|uniref:Extracellular solute-binding protein n=1 Tax=Cellulomonas wangleii TaxID=2816956 RepID=A0ABX8D465_9CELL|nr:MULTISPECIES: extracellular solute-binding protein [Cellulomonas]MBO0899213.1 extracellular solute-binding protein [Cellulomonas sp. zg-ZUI22]MBO0920063.1 extracellular solute-binding protein [Cellulomonas wangleii]MBO0923508.1 extracellular solute-binding protein [Cellulomonas wangleii]QVI61848.1 extracellular solute-binding protein [Cellulomonas wangleii]
MRVTRTVAASAALVMGALVLAACGGSTDEGGQEDGAVTMTFWHNSTTDAGKAYQQEMVDAFEAENPGVEITLQVVQNEEMDGKLQTALNSGDAPDIFMARGGGKLADIAEAGQVMDLTDLVDDSTRDALGGTIEAFTIDGKVYGMPTAVLPGGIFYSKDLFAQAGITSTPTTMAELEQAVAALKAAGIEPIALGAKDAWPAAHWYYFYALRSCSQDTIDQAAKERSFDDPCWTQAGQEFADFAALQPFNSGFLTTSAQQGAGSSAGLVANHQAAMELMGAWNPGVIGGLTPDGEPLADLGWFPFPQVEGGAGDPTAMMGGIDGLSCHVDAPAECAEFLNFLLRKENQEGFAEAFVSLPASKEAQGVVTDPALQEVLAAYDDAAYVSVWLDTLFGQNVGNALNGAVVEMLAGDGDAAGIVSAVNDAAAKE